MITALLIVHNQEHLLKQHLSTLSIHIQQNKGSIMVIDNNSSDNTQEYLNTHFPNIHYMKNTLEEKTSETFNKCLPFIHTPYIMLCDPHLQCIELNIKRLITQCIKEKLFLLTLPISTFNKNLHTYISRQLKFKNATLKIKKTSSPQKQNCIISDAMILRTKDLILQNGLKSQYKSFSFSLFDFSISCLKKGLKQNYSTIDIIRNKATPNSLPYKESKKDYLHDSVLFQYLQCHSYKYKISRFIINIANCLTFKPKKCFATIEAWLQYLFIFKKNKSNWFILKDTDIL